MYNSTNKINRKERHIYRNDITSSEYKGGEVVEIFKLFGNIFVDNEKANESIHKTDKKATGLAGTFGKVGKSALAVGKVLAVGFAAGGAAAIALAIKTGEAADRLLDLSSISGLSTDELQKWERVATVAGVSADAMSNVSQKLTKQMDILSTGTGKSAEALESLGINYDDFAELSADARVNLITKQLGAVEDGTERAKLGTDLLGGSWKDLAPILDVGAEELQNIKDNANIISNDDLNRANEFRINVDTMKESLGIMGQELALKFIPILNKMFDWFKKNGPLIGEIFDAAFDLISKSISTVSEWINLNLIPIFRLMYEWVISNLPLFKAIWEEVFGIIKEVVETTITVFERLFLPILKTLFKWIQKHMPEIKATFKFVFKVIKGIIIIATEIIEAYIDILISAYKYVSGTFQRIGEFFKSAFSGIVDFIQDIIDKIDRFIGKVKDAVESFKKFIGIDKDKLEKPDNRGRGPTPTSLQLRGGYANGTENATRGLHLVGELGPEIVDFGGGERVIPNEKLGGIQNNFNFAKGALIIREEADIKKVARELYNLQVSTNRG